MSQGSSDFGMDIATLVSHASPFQNVIIHIDFKSAFVIDQAQKAGQVAGVKLAGVSGNGSGQIQRTKNRYAVAVDVFAGLGERDVAAGGSSEIDDHRSRSHAVDSLFGEHQRGLE